MDLLPDKKSSELLKKAWDLDQEALLKTKNSKRRKKLWRKSMRICQSLLKKFPREINLLTKIATIYQHQGKFDRAGYFLQKAKKYHPKVFIIDFYFGNLYRAKENHKLAIKYYLKALKKSKNDKLIKKSIEDYRDYLRNS
ncbi:MAG: tetratricopeptide repeat protein [Patescibacteria group bacterium]